MGSFDICTGAEHFGVQNCNDICTLWQFYGVSFDKSKKKFVVQFRPGGGRKPIRESFGDEDEAAERYDDL